MRKTDHFGSITAFVTTAQIGSFTGAAERLGLTKSAIGKSVARLEERLGLTLFHRTTRSLSLTPDGERYLASCQNALEILEHAEQELTSHIAKPAGRLRVDLPAAFGRQKILPILLEITQQYPELELTLSFSERFVDLIEEGIDLVVRIGELEDSSTLIARRLTTQKLVVVASPNYLAQHGTPKTPSDLTQHKTVVGFRRNQPVSWLLQNDEGRIAKFTPPATHEFADGDAMLVAVLNDAGVSQLPYWLVRDYVDAGKLVTILEDFAGGEMPINAVWPKGRQQVPKIRYVIDELVSAAQAQKLE
ncbi:LysR family transcriptional regulator [Marinomonas ostreistagni]|uniref:LysR family transcriptional regulator n=1 Tax=Marinomonas ostreistagni TaxID=359209 RepID=UPI001951746E|nr:LysR family transcriptional regulator [Marinomonas ostreistagni]MBM6550056.1 LysR family transcriptional regulator [Marinomonas ostreistagni]